MFEGLSVESMIGNLCELKIQSLLLFSAPPPLGYNYIQYSTTQVVLFTFALTMYYDVIIMEVHSTKSIDIRVVEVLCGACV